MYNQKKSERSHTKVVAARPAKIPTTMQNGNGNYYHDDGGGNGNACSVHFVTDDGLIQSSRRKRPGKFPLILSDQ